jgi:hypothetical protein
MGLGRERFVWIVLEGGFGRRNVQFSGRGGRKGGEYERLYNDPVLIS